MFALTILLIIIFGFLFLYFLLNHSTNLLTGLFSLVFLSLVISMFFTHATASNLLFMKIVGILFFLVLLSLGLIGTYAMVISSFWSKEQLSHPEKRTKKNYIPLLIVTVLLIINSSYLFLQISSLPSFLWVLSACISGSFLYCDLFFLLYIVTTILYNLAPLRQKVDYIIILGAGLHQDQVTPLLASRIHVGLKVYQQQVADYHRHPTIILSGGKGKNERLSEAAAMKTYIKQLGFSIPTLYLEEHSTNTKENLAFSQTLAQKKDGIQNFSTKQVVIASNNYHLLRAGKLAKQLGFSAKGAGARTKLSFLPYGFMREYIGYLLMTRKGHYFAFPLFVLLFVVFLLKM